MPALLPSSQLYRFGFTIVEVLVALGILALGVMGTTTLQQQAMQQSLAALSDMRARFLLQDIVERMRANHGGALYTITFDAPSPSPTTDCQRQVCDSADLARWDLAEWRRMIEDVAYLPRGEGQIVVGAATGLCTVTIRFGMPARELSLEVAL
jgi:type IV pilus assembly protein PilV